MKGAALNSWKLLRFTLFSNIKLFPIIRFFQSRTGKPSSLHNVEEMNDTAKKEKLVQVSLAAFPNSRTQRHVLPVSGVSNAAFIYLRTCCTRE